MRIITDTQTAAMDELVRRGHGHYDGKGNFVVGGGTKTTTKQAQAAATADGTFGLSSDQLWLLSGHQPPSKAKSKAKAKKAKAKTTAKTTAARKTQHLVKSERERLIRAFCLKSAGFDTPEWDNKSYRALMDQAGVPRRVKGGENPTVKVAGRNTVGNKNKQAAFAKANGISA